MARLALALVSLALAAWFLSHSARRGGDGDVVRTVTYAGDDDPDAASLAAPVGRDDEARRTTEAPEPEAGDAPRDERAYVTVKIAEASLAAAPGPIVDGDVMLVSTGDVVVHASGDLRRAPLRLPFRGDATSAWLTLRRDGVEFEDSREMAYFDPSQPGYATDVYEGRPGLRVRAGDVVELRLVLGAELTGSVALVEDPCTGAWVNPVNGLRVLPAAAERPFVRKGFSVEAIEHFGRMDADGGFTVPRVEPGVVRLELMRDGLVLATIDDLVAAPGGGAPAGSAELEGIDLAHHARVVRLEVVDGEGAPIADPVVWVNGPEGAAQFTCPSGIVDAWLPGHDRDPATIEVAVVATGHAPAWLPRPHVDGRVVLEPTVAVSLGATGAIERDVLTHGFELRLRRIDVPDTIAWVFATEIPWSWHGTDHAELSLPGPGTYELEVRVLQRMGSKFGRTGGERWVGTGAIAEVRGGGETIEVGIPDLRGFIETN